MKRKKKGAHHSDTAFIVVNSEHQFAHVLDEVRDDASLRLGLSCKGGERTESAVKGERNNEGDGPRDEKAWKN
jgi:hypothetical protein